MGTWQGHQLVTLYEASVSVIQLHANLLGNALFLLQLFPLYAYTGIVLTTLLVIFFLCICCSYRFKILKKNCCKFFLQIVIFRVPYIKQKILIGSLCCPSLGLSGSDHNNLYIMEIITIKLKLWSFEPIIDFVALNIKFVV